MARDITSLRALIESLKDEGELLIIDREADPIYEVSGLQRALEEGPVILFEKLKGYPGVRNIGNIFSRADRAARIFGAEGPQELKLKALEAVKHPLPPVEVQQAPSQEVVITSGIDVLATLPIIKHSERDGDRILGGGVTLIGTELFDGGTHVSFNRMFFRGKDWSSIAFGAGSHMESVAYITQRGKALPLTINIGAPPAVMAAAAAGYVHVLEPLGGNELGMAGALQGAPVELVKAKTVDAYAIAQAEWVLEGYVDASQRVWETAEAEALGQEGVAPSMPEWTGYLGKAYRHPRFQVTAITHRKDRPIFYTPLAYSFETDIMTTVLTRGFFQHLADQIRPGLVIDVHSLPGVAAFGSHVIFQVQKRRRSDEGYQRRILQAALALAQGLRMVIAVDEDVDIYNTQDLLWAMVTRVNPRADIVMGVGGGMGQTLMPLERVGLESGDYRYEGGMAIDATVPFTAKAAFERGRYPVGRIDLSRWLSQEELRAIRSRQSEHARLLSQRG